MIPSMHKNGFGLTLSKWAREVGPYSSIVEVGSWLGASAKHLLDNSGDLVDVHLYDKWSASQSEVDKAIQRGENRLRLGESFKHIVEENLSGFGGRLHLHQGDIRQAEFKGRWDIALYVDDASKNNIHNVLPAFMARFRPGTIAILMDYFWVPCDDQRDYIESLGWELLARDEYDDNAAIWRVR